MNEAKNFDEGVEIKRKEKNLEWEFICVDYGKNIVFERK